MDCYHKDNGPGGPRSHIVCIYVYNKTKSGTMLLHDGREILNCSAVVFSMGIWEERDGFTDPKN